MYVSSKAQKEMAPTLAQWLLDRSAKPSATPTAEVPRLPKAAGKPSATPTAEVPRLPKAAGKPSATPAAEVPRIPKAAGKPKTARSQKKRKQKK
jgi:hypothetical protein